MTPNIDNLTADRILNGMLATEKTELFETLLRSTGREGIENIITFLKSTDFYTAPSSASYHSNYPGGLLDHSLLVYATAMNYRDALVKVNPALATEFTDETITISTLLHDICKVSFYKQTQKWKKDENNQWQSYIGYEIDDSFPIGHGEKSVIMLLHLGLKMSAEEMLAIRYHMGSWDGAMLTNDVKYSYQAALGKCPLMTLVQMADNSSSLLFEKQNKI